MKHKNEKHLAYFVVPGHVNTRLSLVENRLPNFPWFHVKAQKPFGNDGQYKIKTGLRSFYKLKEAHAHFESGKATIQGNGFAFSELSQKEKAAYEKACRDFETEEKAKKTAEKLAKKGRAMQKLMDVKIPRIF